MRTLYVRNVPDEVGERLERLAAREGLSLSAFASRELAAISRRADDPALLASLPHLADSGVVHALRSQVLRGDLDVVVAERMIDVWQRLGLERVGVTGILGRVWELRENLSAYDATYVALAEALESPLVTADGRLARAPGPRCAITVVRR